MTDAENLTTTENNRLPNKIERFVLQDENFKELVVQGVRLFQDDLKEANKPKQGEPTADLSIANRSLDRLHHMFNNRSNYSMYNYGGKRSNYGEGDKMLYGDIFTMQFVPHKNRSPKRSGGLITRSSEPIPRIEISFTKEQPNPFTHDAEEAAFGTTYFIDIDATEIISIGEGDSNFHPGVGIRITLGRNGTNSVSGMTAFGDRKLWTTPLEAESYLFSKENNARNQKIMDAIEDLQVI